MIPISSIRARASTGRVSPSGEWRAIVRSNPGRHSILPHRRFANGSDLTQVHSGDDLTADQITTVGVGDRERIATRPITRSKVALKIHAPELIRCRHLGEWSEYGVVRRFFRFGLVKPARWRIF